MFSSQHTFSVVKAIIHFLAPGLSDGDVDFVHAVIRKLAHVVEYFILGFLLFRAFRGPSGVWWGWRWFSLALIVVVVWAISDEFHQSLVPARTASALDVGIDTLGGIIGQIANGLWIRHKGR